MTPELRRTWSVLATTAALVAVLAATTVVALLRANDRGDRLEIARHDLAGTRATLAERENALEKAKDDLADERTSLAKARADLTESERDANDLASCVDSLMTFIVAAANGDQSGMTTALRLSNCDEVMDELDRAGKNKSA